MEDENGVRAAPEQEEREGMSAEDVQALLSYKMAQRYRSAMQILKSEATYYYGDKELTEDNLNKWIQSPRMHERRLREFSRHMYNANGQYRSLCNYQPQMVKTAYILCPASKVPKRDEDGFDAYMDAYKSAALTVDDMNLKTEALKLYATATRDGIVFGYARGSKDTFSFVVLDPEYCRTSSVDGSGCIRFEFDFMYFTVMKKHLNIDELLESFGQEFVEKYAAYQEDGSKRWQEIGENGICMKYQEEILDYSIPPYVAVLNHIFDINDYKKLTKAREEAGNYNLLGFRIPIDKSGKILMDAQIAKKFVEQAESEIPQTIGVLLSPMDIEKFSFEKTSAVAERNAVSDAEEQFWAASGISNLLFGGGKSSANSLNKSIIVDEIDILPLMRQLERWVNRRLKLGRGKHKFKTKFLDVTAFNWQDRFDLLLKAGNAGMPVKTELAATLGYTPYEVLQMAALENDVLDMRESVYAQPLKSSSTMSSNDASDGGRPAKDEDELSPSGEATRENEGNVRE